MPPTQFGMGDNGNGATRNFFSFRKMSDRSNSI